MKIYIASSWKNQHAVEMLTALLRAKGHEIVSWVENNFEEGMTASGHTDFEQWVHTENAQRAFEFDVNGAMFSDLVIYVSPAGTDAWAEVGAAFGHGVTVLGLRAKGEPSGLMRKMVEWYDDFKMLIDAVDMLELVHAGDRATKANAGKR